MLVNEELTAAVKGLTGGSNRVVTGGSFAPLPTMMAIVSPKAGYDLWNDAAQFTKASRMALESS
jgi:hypothetical protein